MRLGDVLRKWRLLSNLHLREVAGAIGISPATLLRIERGRGCDSDTLLAIIKWLGSPSGETQNG